jgi:alpha-tubulin suppressor-like RCC1 family protein
MGDVDVGIAVSTIVASPFDSGFTCAVTTDHAVRCWGANADGELGRDHTTRIGDGLGATIAASGDLWPFGPL